jgi:predicted O-linked N-acetylglucosamine transferase (SPINDLY family)
MGRAEESLAYYRSALAAAPKAGADEAAIGSNLLFALNAVPGIAAAAVFAEHRGWGERHAEPLKAKWRPHANVPEPERRLRVGYLSPDFRRHSVAYFIEPVLAAHDRRQVEVFCYASVLNRDEVTDRLQGLADRWRDVVGLGDGEAAETICADGVDILVDLAGHTGNSRLSVLARKPAPVQGTWLGYPNTSGMTAVDFRVTDSVADPEGQADALHTERLVRLDGGFLCYKPPADAPAVGPLPAHENGFVRFASCNNLAKAAAPAIAAWARILARVPGSRLLLKSKPLVHDGARRLVAERFMAAGVGADRLDMLGWIVDGTHLEVYRRVDVGLDTFPYNGTTTTCEALWMGVPVVTLAGDRHAGRVGASLLARVGLDDLVTRSGDDYVERAVALAGDLGALAALRWGLRGRVAASGLLDAARFARGLEEAYRRLWRQWCAGRRAP